MRKVSKLGVYLPSILLIIVVVFVFTAPRKEKKQIAEQELVQLTPTSVPTPTVHITIDLKGPYTCNYNTKSATVSAMIKNKQIAADFIEATQESHFILNGDCMYSWSSNEINGTKQCGLSPFVSALDLMSSFGIFDFGSIMSMAPPAGMEGVQNKMSSSAQGVQDFLSTCKKIEPDPNAFTVPQNRQYIVPSGAPTPAL